MKVVSIETSAGMKVAERVHVAQTFFTRAIGLMGRKQLAEQEGMLFRPGGSIHTIGMRIAIDVAFLDQEYRVLKTSESLRPFRACVAPRGTKYTLELAPGRLRAAQVAAGAKLRTSS